MRKSMAGLFVAVMLLFVLAPSGPANATDIAVNATADNGFNMYLSTNATTAGTQILTGSNWGSTYSVTAALTPGVTNYLQVYGINSGGPGAFIGSFTLSDTGFHFANGTQSLDTNTTDWFLSATNYNTAPNIVTFYAINGGGPWGFHPSIDSAAQWIWSSDFYAASAYISTPIYSSVPLPPALLLFGPGLFGLAAVRRRFRK